jgi:thiamine-phosphate pyrophosphorylase
VRLPPGLLAITPGTLDARGARGFAGSIERAASAGLSGVLVREPGLSDRDTLALARRLREVLDRASSHTAPAWLALHDRLHLAAACGADGVHLGYRSLPVAEARAILPRGLSLGFSAHAHDDPAAWDAADYLFFGPVLDTPSKEGLVEPTGFEGLTQAVERAGQKPVLALGGLQPKHAARVRETGAAGLAVLRGVLGAEDPAGATRDYLAAWSPQEREAQDGETR